MLIIKTSVINTTSDYAWPVWYLDNPYDRIFETWKFNIKYNIPSILRGKYATKRSSTEPQLPNFSEQLTWSGHVSRDQVTCHVIRLHV